MFAIVIEYQLFVSDNPDATTEQNCDYSFEGVRLVVWRKEDADSGTTRMPTPRHGYIGSAHTSVLGYEAPRSVQNE